MKIHNTRDYSLFKRISGNRVVNQTHVNRLLEAIKSDPATTTYSPVLVNDEFEIIDGQHRFEAMQKLDLPIHYIQVDGLALESVQRLNTVARVWSPIDFAKSFAELGNENYAIYLDFKSKFHSGHLILMHYLSLDIPCTTTSFKEGRFMVQDTARSYELLSYLYDLADYYPRLTQSKASDGVYKVISSPNYDHKAMLKKMEKHGDKFQEQVQVNDWARELERIYNFRNRNNPTMLFSLVGTQNQTKAIA